MIGVDFGGTNIKIAEVVGADVLRTVTQPTQGSPDQILDAIAAGIRSLGASPECIGLAIPGEVDARGVCYRMPNVAGFEGVNIAEALSARTTAKVVVENDSTAAALGELLFGAGKTHASFVVATLGTGIGGGVVLDGRVRRGAGGFAGEIGHVRVDDGPEAWLCPCGQRGCVEAYAGTAGLLRKYRELGGSAAEIEDIAVRARQSDAAALAIFDFMGRALARALTSIQNLLDVDAFVFSGGVSRSFDLIEPELRRALRELAYAKPLAEVPLLVSALGDQAGVVGAAHLPTVFGSSRHRA